MPELFFSNSDNEAKSLSRKAQQGLLRRIRRGVYTDARSEEIASLLHNQWFRVVHYLYPEGIAAYRTARELQPVDGFVVIVANIAKPTTIEVGPSLTLSVLPGDPLLGTEPFSLELRRSNTSRYLLENLSESRKSARFRKSLGAEWVEQQLCMELQKKGELGLNQIRDDAKALAEPLKLSKEFKQLDKLIGALLSSHPADLIQTPIAQATARQEPYDNRRLTLFKALADYLRQCDFPAQPYAYQSAGWRNLAFFESYFSNYIEGTEFLIDEAVVEQFPYLPHDGLEAMRGCLCSKAHVFSGFSSRLKANPNLVAQEVRKVFPDYSLPFTTQQSLAQ